MSLNAALFVLVVLLVVGWFAAGTQYNIRRGDRALRWLQGGLKLIGEKTSLRWLGSSVVELKIPNAAEPFRSAEVLLALEPRDVPFLWWLHHLRGRRDLLIFRGQLRTAPDFDFELFDPHGWTTRGRAAQLASSGLKPLEPGAATPLVAYGSASANASRLASLAPAAASLVRLAVHQGQPHLELHWTLAGAEQTPARELFEQLRDIPGRITAARSNRPF
jgi:hypothetical protein